MTSLFKDMKLQAIIGNMIRLIYIYIKCDIYSGNMKDIVFPFFLALLMSAQINKCGMYFVVIVIENVCECFYF